MTPWPPDPHDEHPRLAETRRVEGLAGGRRLVAKFDVPALAEAFGDEIAPGRRSPETLRAWLADRAMWVIWRGDKATVERIEVHDWLVRAVANALAHESKHRRRR